MIPWAPHPYRREAHEGFVRASWRRGARQPWEKLRRLLADPRTTCIVAAHPEDESALIGWAAVHDGAVVWVYVRDLYGQVRRKGVGAALLLAAGADVSQPTPCLFWSPAAGAIAGREGYRVFYQPRRNV